MRKQLAFPDDTAVTGDSKFAATICSQFTHYYINILRKILPFHKFWFFLVYRRDADGTSKFTRYHKKGGIFFIYNKVLLKDIR